MSMDTMKPNGHEITLMAALNENINEYYELKELAFAMYRILFTISVGSVTLPDNFKNETANILAKCDEFEPAWEKSTSGRDYR
jgi:hypothetical protein